MSTGSGVSPGLVLAFLLGLSIIVFTPLVGWLLLARQRTRPVRMWYSGLAVFAAASLVFTLVPWLGEPVVALLPGALSLACLILLTESIRIEREGLRTRWAHLTLPVAYFVAQWLLLKAGRREFEGVLMQQVLVLTLVLRLLHVLFDLRRRESSRGLLFIQGGTLLLAVVNVLRIIFILHEGRDPGLLGLRPISNLLFILTVMTPVFWSLGYWGFVLERTTRQAALAAARADEEARSLKVAEEHASKLETLIHERDRMILLNSRFVAINNLAVFNAGIVHELSQPLQAMSLSAQELAFLLDQPQTDTEALRRECQVLASRNLQAQSILQGLRSLMGSASPRIELVQVREVVSGVIEVVQSECSQRGVAFEIVDEFGSHAPTIHANKVLFQRVLFNLLGNAIHALTTANPAIDSPSLVLHLQKLSSGSDDREVLCVSIRDNGPGLPSHVLSSPDLLHDSGKPGGLGVGLTLVKTLVGLWDGRFEIHSPWPEGSQGTVVRLWFNTFEGT